MKQNESTPDHTMLSPFPKSMVIIYQLKNTLTHQTAHRPASELLTNLSTKFLPLVLHHTQLGFSGVYPVYPSSKGTSESLSSRLGDLGAACQKLHISKGRIPKCQHVRPLGTGTMVLEDPEKIRPLQKTLRIFEKTF